MSFGEQIRINDNGAANKVASKSTKKHESGGVQLWNSVVIVWFKCRFPVLVMGGFWIFAQGHAQAQQTPDPTPELRRQQERTEAQRQRLEGGVDIRSEVTQADTARLPRNESPCFIIKHVEIHIERHGNDLPNFDWLAGALNGPLHDDSPVGKCLGANGIGVVLKRAQDAVVAHGFVTTRVLAQAQDLTNGVLTLTVIPGRVNAIRLANTKTPAIRSAVPIQAGDILNLRDIEQALENLKRVPTAEADIQIEASPTAGPDQSDLVISYTQTTPARFTATLDDSGSRGTGKFQGSSTLSLDNPLDLSDLFYLTLNHDLNTELGHALGNTLEGDRGTRGYTVHYSLPLGYWVLGGTHTSGRYYQMVAGLNQSYLYSGTSENNDITLSRLIYRDAVKKTSISIKAWQRESNNFIDDTEVLNQRRSVGGFELSLNHKDAVGDTKLEGSIAYKRGTKDFDAIPAPEESFNEGTAKFGLWTLDASVNAPFKMGEQGFKYNGAIHIQDNSTPLTPQDRFSIGSRYSVRGFDGETSLVGERGWSLRNEVSTALGASGQDIYLGIDAGEVSGPSTRFLLGNTLSGAVIGLRGAYRRLQYDVFVGTPLYKPAGFKTADTTAGFNLTLSL